MNYHVLLISKLREIIFGYFGVLLSRFISIRTLASSSQISCRTSAANSTTYSIFHLYLRIDNSTLSINQPFMYTDDPTIQKIAPLKSFLKGGRLMTIAGTNFSSVQQPRMAVFYNNTVLNESVSA